MKIVPFTEDFYPIALVWWKERSFPSAPMEDLRSGMVIAEETENGLKPICMGFLNILEHHATIYRLVSDPLADKNLRKKYVDFLILSLSDLAKSRGCKFVCGLTNIPDLVQRYEKLGFMIYDRNVTILGRNI